MPTVKFTKPFRWKPKPSVSIRYPEGHEGSVTRACAEAAIAKGYAVKAGGADKGGADAVEDPQSGKAG
ncbi:hypothetical protein [Alloyangia pacifica]|uniref:hypothetical protein n=1 Tax=Alloyangia pacifica TaxID=311180 RepID=UPI00131F0080|nr:hypothetical protein [Alloyangia pacifica]